MVIRYSNIWKLLPFIALGLMLVRDLAPISDSLDEVFSGMVLVIMLLFAGIYFWQERRARQADQSNSAAISSND